jgi:hypothetical protein
MVPRVLSPIARHPRPSRRQIGLRAREIIDAAQDEGNKLRLRNQTELARTKGIFVAPTVFVGAQQAFVLAWKSIRTLKSPAAFGAWLRKLAVNCWLQHARIKRHEVALADEALCEGHASSGVTERLDLDAALATLPPHARLCVVLAYSEGMIDILPCLKARDSYGATHDQPHA